MIRNAEIRQKLLNETENQTSTGGKQILGLARLRTKRVIDSVGGSARPQTEIIKTGKRNGIRQQQKFRKCLMNSKE